jgi:hypothetical protein
MHASAVDSSPTDLDRTGIGVLEAAQEAQQRDLATARGALSTAGATALLVGHDQSEL